MLTFAVLLLVISLILDVQQLCATKDGKACARREFKGISEGNQALHPSNLISNHTIHLLGECHILCISQDNCYGYNYRVRPSTLYTANCQLSNSTVKMNKTKMKNGPWIFYEDILVTATGGLTSCLDIKKKGLSHGDGEYFIDPDGDGPGKPFQVYCDMTSFGGGWTMCYTTDSHVNIKTELVTTPALGYRADCNNILFTGVMFVDEASKQKAAFTNGGSPVTFTGNYDKDANAYGLWTAQGVATTQYKYQMLICDTTFYKGLHFSGFTSNCYKKCDSWCGDTSSTYFRTSTVSDQHYNGVAFNEKGHYPKPKRLISVGIR
ncbi:uncharacterized protein LOC114542547 [Dendronephthya gigantea]|uniref:uncharacterized protein LOC114542547 n=1 Tax=Dendronephthya gigantea TaxID=151771 RepID=UPI00106A19EA|nr:uncharacterized protein LOC114542547 [Dendronephthya gigantea]